MSADRPLDTGTGELLARVERGVGIVVLNRPERRNALTFDLLATLGRVLGELEGADDVGAVVLTGAGGAFSAGGDVKAFAARGGAGADGGLDHDELVATRRAVERATSGRLHGMAKPTVAALPGAVAGAAVGLALACDLRVGSSATVLATAFAGVGLSGDYGTAWLLTRLVGPARARRLMFLGERLRGDVLLEWGLVDWLVGPGEELSFALDTAAALAAGPGPALTAMKRNLLDAETLSLEEAMDREVPRHLECGRTGEHKALVAAFAAKAGARH